MLQVDFLFQLIFIFPLFQIRNCLIVKGETRVVFRMLLEKGCLVITPLVGKDRLRTGKSIYGAKLSFQKLLIPNSLTIAAACAEIKRRKFRYFKDQVIFRVQTKLSIDLH